MKIKAYKNIILLCLFWITCTLLIEYIMTFFFSEIINTRAILAISFVSAFGSVYPFLKNSKDFSFDKIKIKQERIIPISDSFCRAQFNKDIVDRLKSNKFNILHSDLNRIDCKTKFRANSSGEKYSIDITKKEIIIRTNPLLIIFPFDEGVRYKQTNLIEKEINSLLLDSYTNLTIK